MQLLNGGAGIAEENFLLYGKVQKVCGPGDRMRGGGVDV